MTRYVGAILLALIWTAVTGSFTLPNLLLGFTIGVLALYIVRESVASSFGSIRYGAAAVLLVIFLKELVLSAWRVARLVVSPRMDLKPGIFAYPLAVKGDFEISLLANLITLTPGTLSVDVSADRKWLFVHAIDCSDPDQTRRDIERTFERRIAEAFG